MKRNPYDERRAEAVGSAVIRWLFLIVLAIVVAFAILLKVVSIAEGAGLPVCKVSRAVETRVAYRPAGDNTQVLLVASCDDAGGAYSDSWYLSFYEGDQPDLRGWAEIQRTASDLLRGGAG